VSIPIHHLESLLRVWPQHVSPPALDLCWEQGVAVNFLSEYGHLQARLTGVADTSVTLRRAQFRAADEPARCAAIARQIVAGKVQNARNSLLRAARETESEAHRDSLQRVVDGLARQIPELAEALDLDRIRGAEGLAFAAVLLGVQASCSNNSRGPSLSRSAVGVLRATGSIACSRSSTRW